MALSGKYMQLHSFECAPDAFLNVNVARVKTKMVKDATGKKLGHGGSGTGSLVTGYTKGR